MWQQLITFYSAFYFKDESYGRGGGSQQAAFCSGDNVCEKACNNSYYLKVLYWVMQIPLTDYHDKYIGLS